MELPDNIDIYTLEAGIEGITHNLLEHMDACEVITENIAHVERNDCAHSHNPTEAWLMHLNIEHIGASMDNLREQVSQVQAIIDNNESDKDIITRMMDALNNMKEKDNE